MHELYNMRGRDLKVYELNVYFQIQIHKKYSLWFTSRVKMPCNIKIMKPVMGVNYDSALVFRLWIMTFRISEHTNRVHSQPKSHFKWFQVYMPNNFSFLAARCKVLRGKIFKKGPSIIKKRNTFRNEQCIST